MNDTLTLAIAAAALLVSFAAVVYSRRQTGLAAEQLELARRIQIEASEPYVIADIVPRVGGSGLLQFRIENIGPTLARDVQLTVSPPLQGGGHDEWDQTLARVVARKIPVLPPGRHIAWHFASGFTIFKNASLPRQYTVTVNATGPAGPVTPLTYIIDLNAIDGSALESGTVEASLAKIADHTKNLKDIPTALRRVAGQLEVRSPAGPDPASPLASPGPAADS